MYPEVLLTLLFMVLTGLRPSPTRHEVCDLGCWGRRSGGI